MTARLGNKARKDLIKIFGDFGLRITTQTNQKVTNFPDIPFNITTGKFHPYRKPDYEPLYVHSHSNHPASILRHIPASINRRICQPSSGQESFQRAIPIYKEALKRSNSHKNPQYIRNQSRPTQRNRQRKVKWFNPPFSRNVKTNVRRTFLTLIDNHFPATSKLHKIFHRSIIEVSHSCMGSIKATINQHNARIIRKKRQPASEEVRTYDCRNKNDCPLRGNCLETNVVYKTEVLADDNGGKKIYVGMTANSFKQRYRNHQKSFNNEEYNNEIELPKHVETATVIFP